RILLPRPVLIDIRTCRSSDIGYFSRLEHLDIECNFDVFAHEEAAGLERDVPGQAPVLAVDGRVDRKSTRLNSSHRTISYAVFCSVLVRALLSFPTRRSSDLRILLPRPVLIDIRTCRSSDIGYFSRLEHLDIECNFDVFAHEEAAGLERDVPGQAPVLAVDGR